MKLFDAVFMLLLSGICFYIIYFILNKNKAKIKFGLSVIQATLIVWLTGVIVLFIIR